MSKSMKQASLFGGVAKERRQITKTSDAEEIAKDDNIRKIFDGYEAIHPNILERLEKESDQLMQIKLELQKSLPDKNQTEALYNKLAKIGKILGYDVAIPLEEIQ